VKPVVLGGAVWAIVDREQVRAEDHDMTSQAVLHRWILEGRGLIN